MAKYRGEMRKYYYDLARYESYLQQLGITYPAMTIPATPTSATSSAPGAAKRSHRP